MLDPQSFFVSGAIPALLWVLVLSLINNFIILPWVSVLFGTNIPEVNLPGEVWTLAGWIITGLLTKKCIDGNAFYSRNGALLKPSRSEENMNTLVSPSSPFNPDVPSAYHQEVQDDKCC